jgi:hypothetical protein
VKIEIAGSYIANARLKNRSIVDIKIEGESPAEKALLISLKGAILGISTYDNYTWLTFRR